MRGRFVDADLAVTVPVADTVTIANTLSRTRRRRFAVD